ncbi:MAG: AAA family ATPase [Desulfovibrionaceae bacterium]|nr:AAA family ATPase [Desulfovibrionaceae bacterium]
MTTERISVGSEMFESYIDNDLYYVDKTSYLKTILLDSYNPANIFIRPRRFGKTLNLNTIASFCNLNYQNPGDKSYQEKYFLDNGRNLAVTQNAYKELRAKFMGEFPVIWISFKDIEGDSYIKALYKILDLIYFLYLDFEFLSDSTKISKSLRENFDYILKFCMNHHANLFREDILVEAELIAGKFLSILALILYKEYSRKVMIFIDEYDVPLQKSLTAKEPYYDKMLAIIRDISSQTFKPGRVEWLYRGLVTGCLKIAHQSIFTGANNFTLNNLNDQTYAGFFGFTLSETEKLLSDCELSLQYETIKEWYDGYRIGDKHLFCPWSVLQFCYKVLNTRDRNSKIEAEPFWVNTSGNDAINIYLENTVNGNFCDDIQRIEKLLNNVPLQIELQEFETYPDIRDEGVDFNSCMTFLLQTGYLTFTEDSPLNGNVFLKIPNNEIFKCFELKLKKLYTKSNPVWLKRGKKLLGHLLANETNDVCSVINQFLTHFISIRNTGHEFYYHGFILGILTMVAQTEGVVLKSEQETGDGYSDIIISNENSGIVVILELKRTENDPAKRRSAAENAAKQIMNKKYFDGFDKSNYAKIYGLGIGFGGKECVVKPLGNLLEISKN